MRKTLMLLTPLLLAGCILQSASYYVGDQRDHAITVLARQDYFWDDKVALSLVAARHPDCQRAIPLAKLPKGDVAVELFSNGESVFTVRSGTQVVQVDMQSCTQLPEPAQNALGDAVGVFRLGETKMGFEPVTKPAAITPQS
jgi:hypothetical protein